MRYLEELQAVNENAAEEVILESESPEEDYYDEESMHANQIEVPDPDTGFPSEQPQYPVQGQPSIMGFVPVPP